MERARAATEVRALADDVSEGLARPWADAVRRASVSRLPDLGDRLDGALAGTDLGVERIPAWGRSRAAPPVAARSGSPCSSGWLGALAVMGYSAGAATRDAAAGGCASTALLVGGVLAGVLLAAVCRLLVSATARHRAHAADQRLRRRGRSARSPTSW